MQLLLRKLISNQNSCYRVITVQDNLLVRVILIWRICLRSNWQILYWQFELPRLFSRLEQWLYGCVHIIINIGDFNIVEFSEKLPITNLIPCQ